MNKLSAFYNELEKISSDSLFDLLEEASRKAEGKTSDMPSVSEYTKEREKTIGDFAKTKPHLGAVLGALLGTAAGAGLSKIIPFKSPMLLGGLTGYGLASHGLASHKAELAKQLLDKKYQAEKAEEEYEDILEDVSEMKAKEEAPVFSFNRNDIIEAKKKEIMDKLKSNS